MTETEPRVPAQARSSEPAQPHEVFVSYSRADREIVVDLVAGLDARGLRAWVDLEDIPPSAEWMAEIRAAIVASDGYLVVVSPSLASSEVCAEELELAREAGKRIVPVMVRPTDPSSVPATLAALNWIDATDGALDQAVDRAVEALRTDLDHVRAHTKLGVRSAEWERKDDTKALLLRGAEIAEAEAVVASSSEPRATPAQARYVQASRSAATRRQRGTVAIAVAVAMLSVSLGVVAWTQRGQAIAQRNKAEHEADASLSRQLVVQSSALLEEQPDLGILLSIEAYRASPTPEARIALSRSAWQARLLKASLRESPARLHIALSPDGTTLASAGQEGVGLWDFETGQQIDRFPYEGSLREVAFSPDGNTIAAGSHGAVVLWDRVSGELLRELEQPGWVETVAFASDGDVIASAGRHTIFLWDSATGRQLDELQASHGSVTRLAISPDGQTLASGDNFRTVQIWDIQSGRQISSFSASDDWVLGVAFSPDGSMLAIATYDGVVWLWDVASGRRVKELSSGGGYATSVAFSPDGRTLASGTSTGSVLLWDVATGRRISALKHTGFVRRLLFSRDGATLAAASDDGVILLWDVEADRQLTKLDAKGLAANDVTFSPDGGTVAWGGYGPPHITTWDIGLDRISEIPLGARRFASVWSIAFNRGGDILAAGGRGGPVMIWDVDAAEPMRELSATHDVFSVAFSPGGQTLATAERDGVLLWDVATWQQTGGLRYEGSLRTVAFSPDQRTLAVANGAGSVLLWNTETREPIGELSAGSSVFAIAFSPDGRFLASGGADGKVLLWDARTLRRIGELSAGSSVFGIAFSPDGNFLASGRGDGTVTLWNVAIRQVIGEFKAGAGVAYGVSFSPDGQLLATGTDVQGQAVWSLPDWTIGDTALIDELCNKVRRSLTRVEWRQYVPVRPYRQTCPEYPVGI